MTTLSTLPGLARVDTSTGRELVAGERYFSALIDHGEEYVRHDYAVESWTGPPESTIAFWSGRVPATDRPKKPTFPEEALLECVRHPAENPARRNFRYVVALLLLRRRKLKFEDTRLRNNGKSVLVVREQRTGELYEIDDPELTEIEIAAVEEEVSSMLGRS